MQARRRRMRCPTVRDSKALVCALADEGPYRSAKQGGRGPLRFAGAQSGPGRPGSMDRIAD